MLVDALVVRTIVLPSPMMLLDRWNWWSGRVPAGAAPAAPQSPELVRVRRSGPAIFLCPVAVPPAQDDPLCRSDSTHGQQHRVWRGRHRTPAPTTRITTSAAQAHITPNADQRGPAHSRRSRAAVCVW